MATVGYSDDAEHYGSGVRDVPAIVAELGHGSIHTGIGFAWGKFSAFATDWDQQWAHQDPAFGLSAEGVSVTSYDIWQGGVVHTTLERTRPEAVEVRLGKYMKFGDKHSPAAESLLSKLRHALRRL